MPDLLHSIQITDPDYERAAVTWKSDFLLMPLFACEEALKYMQGMPGVTTPTKLPSVEGGPVRTVPPRPPQRVGHEGRLP